MTESTPTPPDATADAATGEITDATVDAPEGPALPEPQLDRVEERVLASLIEKAITTPDYYPLTLNSLTAACRQKSNRDPVVDVDDQTVAAALGRLQDASLTRVVTGADQRVPKYRHVFGEVYGLQPAETALMCELMLRGPQTLGELRTRAGRMHAFEDLAQVESAMQSLCDRTVALATQLERQPGRKEPRYAHRLAGEPASPTPSGTSGVEAAVVVARAETDRLQRLEAQVEQLQAQVEQLQQQLDTFRQQFE
ncbi:MAG: YceH family protein [Gemmatimonadetes bacterium]|jgi:uncharacterized protein|nr:YceH family protein [Gemmatimonadota bacterium]MBT6146604.1 YceH family protein [Gemmatimonadota bacterium]MBT7863240.1 YceH family protein [Gemmatimonadota bacterium]